MPSSENKKRVFVPHSRCRTHFNYFTQDNFMPKENVIALRWNRCVQGEKTIVKYYEIEGMFKWVFQSIYLGEDAVTPDNRLRITSYQADRIRRIYMTIKDREFINLGKYNEYLRKKREKERDEAVVEVPEDIADVPLNQRLLTIDRTYSETRYELVSLQNMYDAQLKVSERLETALQVYNRRNGESVSWQTWTRTQGVSVHDPVTISSVRADLRRQIKQLKQNTFSMFEEVINTHAEVLQTMNIAVNLDQTEWADSNLMVVYTLNNRTGTVPLYKFVEITEVNAAQH